MLPMLRQEEGGRDWLPVVPTKKKRSKRMLQRDRISDLPDPLAHHIMSFLPTLDITKLSILSKRFFFLWRSFPVIDFDQSTFNYDYRTDDFLDHIGNSIRLRRLDTVISEFRVRLNSADMSGFRVKAKLKRSISCNSGLYSAISFALDNGVKSMDLDFGVAEYPLPSSFASRSINVLKLKRLSNLDLCELITGCPSLKTLSLYSCTIVRDIEFSSQTLREIELHCCDLKFIKIVAPNLHSFSYDSGMTVPKPCTIDVLQCENIAYLSINNVVNAQDWVVEHTSTLRKLETFIFNGCRDIKSIRIRNARVEKVEIGNFPSLDSIEVRAPSLESFKYKGSTTRTIASIAFIASKSIKDLYIENAGITDEWLETELPTLSYLKSLRLNGCQFFNRISIRNERVETVEIVNCPSLTSIEVMAPSLESFQYINGTKTEDMVSNISFIDSESMKDLYIENAGITDECLKAQLTSLCYLKSLRLKACNSLKTIEVIHEKLQILEFLNCKKLEVAEIDTPELVSFVHIGKILYIGNMVTRSIFTATLSINPWEIPDDDSSKKRTFYGSWRKMLSFFGHCKTLKLICNCQQELMIPGDLRETLFPPLYDLECLEVHVNSTVTIKADLVDSLLWLVPHPKTIRIYSGSGSKLRMTIKFVYNETMMEEEDDDKNPCCKGKPIKCWKHKLKRLDIQTTYKIKSGELQKYFHRNAIMLETLNFFH